MEPLGNTFRLQEYPERPAAYLISWYNTLLYGKLGPGGARHVESPIGCETIRACYQALELPCLGLEAVSKPQSCNPWLG